MICALLAAALCTGLAACGSASETKTQSGAESQPSSGGKTAEEIMALNDGPSVTIETDGATYKLNKDLKTYLFIGVDDTRTAEEKEEKTEVHACDTLILYIVDEAAKTYSTLSVSRDTIAVVDMLDFDGEAVTQAKQQLAYAYGYTDKPEINSENVVRAISRLLGGINIDGYVTLGYNAIPAVNDVIGGVTVTIEDDFSEADPSLVKGETVTLTGEHAMQFVRNRMTVGDGENPGRMRRQQTYLGAFTAKLKNEVKDSSGIINDLYNAALPYMTSNMSAGEITNTALSCLKYSKDKELTLTGTLEHVTYKTGITNAEYYVEQSTIDSAVLQLFYTKTD